jgi:Fe-S-cluster containining protein
LSSPSYDCQLCGACCSTSREWPRFSLESDEEIERIPEPLREAGGMRCEGERCLALSGVVGEATRCTVYALRPLVCRDCEPGDPEGLEARRTFGLPV